MASAPSLTSENAPLENSTENALLESSTLAETKTDSPPETSAPTQKQSERLEWIDVFRGLAIVAVAVIHTTGSCLKLRRPPDTSWYCMEALKALLQFAVPAFLMLSALVLTRSLLRDASPGRYTRNRLQTVLWPTVLWTALCIPYAHWLRPDIGWPETAQRVLDGTAQFHLYFLRVLLQLCAILPFLLPLARQRPAFWKILLLTVFTTLDCFFLNRLYWKITTPASWLFWYVPSLFFGMWLATQNERWVSIARRGWFFSALVMILSGSFYLSYALREAEGFNQRTPLYPISQWIFVSSASFLLFGIAVLWSERPKARLSWNLAIWRFLGRNSLPIYLLHPVMLAVQQKLIEPHFVNVRGYVPLKLLALLFVTRLIFCIITPLFIARILEKCRLSPLFFGR